MAKPYTLNAALVLDTKGALSQAEKFGTRFGEIVAKAQSVRSNPKLYAALDKNAKDFEKKQKAAIQRLENFELIMEVRKAKREVQERTKLETQIARLRQELNNDNLDWEARKQKEAEAEVAKVRLRHFKKSEADLKKGIREIQQELQQAAQAIEKDAKNVDRITSNIETRMERSRELADGIRDSLKIGSEEFISNIEGGLDSIASSLKGDLDIGSMVQGAAGKISSGLGKAGDLISGEILASGGAAAGAISAAALGLTAGIGILVAGFAAFIALMIDVDKEVKELNKTTIATFGTRSAMGFGLNEYRHAIQDLNNTLGMSADEANQMFDSLDQGGYSLSKLARGATDSATKTRNLVDTMQKVSATATALGIGISELSTQATDFSQTFATSLEDVVGQFSRIGKMASEAGFSTRRFYSLVVQASAGQSALNTRMDETAELLMRMSKILGDKQAAEFMGNIGNAFKSAATGDLMKTAMITGIGNMREIAEEELRSQSRVFLAEAKREGGGGEETLTRAAGAAGVTVNLANEESLVSSLQAMTEDERNRFISAVQTQDSNLGRRLDELTRVSETAAGGITDLPTAMRSFSTGGVIKTYAKMAESMGLELGSMNAIQRMYFANASGLSEDQISEMERMNRSSEGAWGVLQNQLTNQTLTNEQLMDQYGVQIEEGKIVDRNHSEIASALDWLTHATETGVLGEEEAMSEDMALAYRAFDETVAIGDILSNEVTNYLRGIYEDVGLPLVEMISDLLGIDDQKEARNLQKALSEEIRDANRDLISTNREISEIEHKKSEERTDEEKATLEEALGRRSALEDTIRELGAMRDRAGSGDVGNMIQDVQEYGVLTDEERASKTRAEAGAAAVGLLTAGTWVPEVDRRAVSGNVYASREAALEAAGGDENLVEARASSRENASGAASRLRREAESRSRGRTTSAAAEAARVSANAGSSSLMSTAPATAPNMSVAPATAPNMSVAPATAPAAAPARPAAAPAAAPAMTPGTAAPTTSPTAAAAATREGAARHDETIESLTSLSNSNATVTREEGEASRGTLETESEDTRKHLTKILTKEHKLGNALAASNLPQAIVDAQVKQKMESLLYASGVAPAEIPGLVDKYMEEGILGGGAPAAIKSAADVDPGIAAMLNELGGRASDITAGRRMRGRVVPEAGEGVSARGDAERPLEDFIYRGDGVRGTIHPIDERDTFVGMKPGGAIDRAIGGGGGGGGVIINIHGGDERRVFEVVKRVLSTSGIGPTRVGARA